MKYEEDPGLLLYVVSALKSGVSLDEALNSLGEKHPTHPWVKAAIELSEESGGSLAPLLESAARALRQKKEVQDKLRALSAQAMASAWVVGLTPLGLFLALLLVSPEYIGPLFKTRMGYLILLAVFLLVSAGFWMVRRLNRLDE